MFPASKNSPQSSINKSYRHSRRYFQDEIHYSSPFRSSKISVVLALSANDDDDDPSLSNDAIVPEKTAVALITTLCGGGSDTP